MRKYPFLCLILAASMLFAASGCGSAESSDSVNVPSEPVKPTTAAVETSIVTTAEPTTEAPTEPTTADSSELFAYYDALAAEWEKTGDTTPSEASINSFHLLGIYNGTAYVSTSYYDHYRVYTVDKDNVGKQIIDIQALNNNKSGWQLIFCNGYTYIIDSETSLHEFDPSGNEVTSVVLGNTANISLLGATPAGDVIIRDGNYNIGSMEGKKLFCFSDDLSVKREVPMPKYEVQHGLTEEYLGNDVSLNNVAYGHKIYGPGNLYLDCETLEWVNYEDGGSVNTFNIKDDSYSGVFVVTSNRCIGRYCLTKYGIYDMETDEWYMNFGDEDHFAQFSHIDFPNSYFGGTSNIERVPQGVSVQQYPSDGSQPVELKKYDVKLIDEYSQFILDDERYIVCDKYGIFVHTFEKGDSEEIQAILFDK